jgi:hypothetical protein
MSVLLFVMSAVAFVSGAVMVGFGIPVNEFSFGNTLISSGVTAIVGGLILGGLGATVAQLQRVAEALSVRPPRANRPIEGLDTQMPAGTRPGQWDGRVPFPPKSKFEAKSEAPAHEPLLAEPRISGPADAAHDERPGQSFAPMLRNPDEPPVAVGDFDEAPLSPRHNTPAPMPRVSAEISEREQVTTSAPPFAANGLGTVLGSGMADKHQESAFDNGWRLPPPSPRPPHSASFDAMWPAELRAPKAPKTEDARPAAAKPEPLRDRMAPAFDRPGMDTSAPRPVNDVRAVAILKSGMVDGMAYTLYVDGSIEAELPQGILRFASINELRTHLEKNA